MDDLASNKNSQIAGRRFINIFRKGETVIMMTMTNLDNIITIKIQPKIIDLSTRLWGITTEFVGLFTRASC